MIDYKKYYKELYGVKTKPQILNVPKMPFITIEGEGNPNGEAFKIAVEALYSLSYAVKMSYKSANIPEGYYEYKVFPLEGVWDLVDYTIGSEDKDNLKYKIMIRQPDFLSVDLFESFREKVSIKKPNPNLNQTKFEYLEEGLCCQILHLGSFDTEDKSFELMEAFCNQQGFTRSSKIHREIYFSDPRKTVESKLKTILRFQIHQD
ncbi:GyrI-like domain-containing protein [Fusibacter bizertensis]